MKTIRSVTDFNNVLKYCFILFCFLIFNCIEIQVLPYSSAVLVTALVNGASIIITPLLYLASFIILGCPTLLAPCAIFAGVISLVTFIYRKFRFNCRFEIIAYTLIGLVGFLIMGNNSTISLEKKVLTVFLVCVLTILTNVAGKAVKLKGLKFKLSFEEVACLWVIVALFGLGVCRLSSPFVWKGFCAFTLLAVCYLYRSGTSALISTVLGVSLAIFYNDLNYVGILLVWSASLECFLPVSRYAGALSLLVADYLLQVIFSVYPDYQLIEFICILIGCALFCLIPSPLIKNLKERLYSFREKQLTRESINRTRQTLSGRLYDLSGVFTEMANAFTAFKKNTVTESSAKFFMQKQMVNSVCLDCNHYSTCSIISQNTIEGLDKLIDVGFAKGKLSLIDIPREITNGCSHPNNLLFALNKMLSDYRLKLIEDKNLSNSRDLLASEVLGVAEILRGLALDTGCLVKYHSELERKLSDNLFKAGFSVNELLIYGENEFVNVSIVTAMKEFSIIGMQTVISKTIGVDMELVSHAKITEEKSYLSFKKTVDYQAVFGIAKATKDGSDTSGDTHSVIRLNNDKFLLALSDGMGSGKDANAISSASLSLIESFYKAGLDSNLILQTVNKLLAINAEDTFTALDVSVIDLKTCSADFIKYGAPYGFIVNDNGIKIVEGNTLPLGILDQLKPSVATTLLDGGDMIILITDGISDAFGNSSEIIDFLRSVTAKNPQTLADEILQKALSLTDGKKNDDMTVLAVRVYKRTA